MKTKLRILAFIITALFLTAVFFACAFYNGIFLFNNPSYKLYPIRGVDVSSYQGEIDWSILNNQNISFAYIKATEGSSHTDVCFAYNWEQAQKTDLAVGAYHFFSFDSPGATQAENFIKSVLPFDGMLPPVIDVEFYGDKEKNPPAKDTVTKELCDMINALEKHYGLKPVLYVTEKSYDIYIKGDFTDYDIWFRNVISKAAPSDGRKWTFWQYTNRERLDGYNGKEKFIDMNVFNGSNDEFNSYPRYIKNTEP